MEQFIIDVGGPASFACYVSVIGTLIVSGARGRPSDALLLLALVPLNLMIAIAEGRGYSNPFPLGITIAFYSAPLVWAFISGHGWFKEEAEAKDA